MSSDLLQRYQQEFAHVLETPRVTGRIRAEYADFQVDEQLGFVPSGEGEHCFLRIRKQGENSEAVAQHIARFAGVRAHAVSYSGLKDRNAITTQWFGVHLPKRTKIDWTGLNSDKLTVLEQTWHQKKLRRGVHQGNRFRIVVSDLRGELETLEARLQWVGAHGVPNYFGQQRFGIDGRNLLEAERMLLSGYRPKSRHLRSVYYSAARSLLFNSVLSERVTEGTWDQALDGDLLQFDASQSFFVFDGQDDQVKLRVANQQLHPSGPLWGKGSIHPQRASLAIERKVLEDFLPICAALEDHELQLQRRSLRLKVNALTWTRSEAHQLELSFSLVRGAYATAVLQEILRFDAG
ncbi:MAG TPA: tRNA pseudouridine(13) synthase TruD [Pseudomonadales bacterium]|nr:tRNA pseudouridine(13) synthase TruD [Pseudomonadales bacterium]